MTIDQGVARILVIEYDRWARADLVAHLQGAGYEVRDASNGFSGLRHARAAPPDLIVLGEALPEIPPLDVRRQLDIDPSTRTIPVITVRTGSQNPCGSLSAEIRPALEARNN
jgi:DNA-binding response OmpR family regulator